MIGYNIVMSISAVIDNFDIYNKEDLHYAIPPLVMILKYYSSEVFICIPCCKILRILYTTDSIYIIII